MTTNIRAYYKTDAGTLYKGNCKKILEKLPDESVQAVITSPPYWKLRDYKELEQLGLEKTLEKYIYNLVEIFQEVKRILRKDGTFWLNIGDRYIKKNVCGIPWHLAFALQKENWLLRQDIIWHKINPTPEPIKDRCTKAHEYLFMFSKSMKYYYDQEQIREPIKATSGKAFSAPSLHTERGDYSNEEVKNYKNIKGANKRSVWSISTYPYKGSHKATFPTALVIPCVLAGTKAGDTILDPFAGTNTTGLVCEKYKRKWIAIELSEDYCKESIQRIKTEEVVPKDKSILKFLKKHNRKIKRRRQ